MPMEVAILYKYMQPRLRFFYYLVQDYHLIQKVSNYIQLQQDSLLLMKCQLREPSRTANINLQCSFNLHISSLSGSTPHFPFILSQTLLIFLITPTIHTARSRIICTFCNMHMPTISNRCFLFLSCHYLYTLIFCLLFLYLCLSRLGMKTISGLEHVSLISYSRIFPETRFLVG